MLSEDKFFEKSDKFALYPTVDGNYFTFEELKEAIKDIQTDKDDKLIILYAADTAAQHSYIEAAKEKGYQVLLLDSPIVSHLIQKQLWDLVATECFHKGEHTIYLLLEEKEIVGYR